MAGSDYKVVNVDLGVFRDRGTIIERDVLVTSVTVLAVTPGAVATIHAGQRQGIPIVSLGEKFSRICETEGIFISNAAQPGNTVQLYVGFSKAEVSLEA
jgi:hypothetical protein